MKLLSFLNLTVASVVLCLTTAGCSSGKFAGTSVMRPKVSDVKKKPVSPQGPNGEPQNIESHEPPGELDGGDGGISTSLVPGLGWEKLGGGRPEKINSTRKSGHNYNSSYEFQ